VPAACDDQVGVALAQPDALVGHAQPMREDLRERRLVALADMLRAGDQRHRAVGLEADVDILLRRAAGSLDVIGEAQAAQPALGLALPAPVGKAFQVGSDQRVIEGLGKGAAVDLEAEAVGHRHGVGRHHVDPSQLGAVEAMPLRRGVDQAFQDVHRLGEAWSARDADRRGVAEDGHDMERNCGDAVHRALQMDVLVGLHAPAVARHVGAEIGDAGDLERQELAALVERQRTLGLHIARGVVG